MLAKKNTFFDIVTINNLFANIDDLDDFVESIISVLSEKGLIIIESSYLPDMMDSLMFDFIYHEHLSCLSIYPLEKFFGKYNMRLIDLQHVKIKNGSMRYYFANNKSKHIVKKSVEIFKKREKKLKLKMKAPYEDFSKKINKCKNELLDYLEKNKGKRIIGYGASATTTTFIYHFGIHNFIEYLVDDFKQKIGTFSPGYNLEVLDPSAIYYKDADIVLIIAWRYAKQIVERQSDFKGTFLIPLPEFKVYKN